MFNSWWEQREGEPIRWKRRFLYSNARYGRLRLKFLERESKVEKAKYVKIFNEGAVHRRCWEVVGIGNKQSRKDDLSIIGQFHSGFKMAIVAALRIGLRVAVSSSDERGPYVLSFSAKEIKFTHQGREMVDHLVCYNYSDGSVLETTLALSAFPEWTNIIGAGANRVYPILREFIANAMDEDPGYGIKFDVAEVEQADSGSTAVYVEQTDEVETVLSREGAYYFKFLESMPLARVAGAGAIYPKSSPGITRLFNHGYLVDCGQEHPLSETTIYDYDAYGKDFISEERIISSRWLYRKQLARLFVQISDYNILRTIIDFACDSTLSLERRVLGRVDDWPDEFGALCLRIWQDKYGEKAVLSSGRPELDAEVQTRGYAVVYLGAELRQLFHKSGVEDSGSKINSLDAAIVRRSLTDDEGRRLKEIRECYLQSIKYYEDIVRSCPIRAIVDESGRCRGLTAADYTEIFIEERCFALSDHELLLTLIHELRHFYTRLPDGDYRRIMHYADSEVVFLLQLLAAALRKLRELRVNPRDICEEFGNDNKNPE